MNPAEFTVEELNHILRLIGAWPANEKADSLSIRQKIAVYGEALVAQKAREQRAVAAAVEKTDKKKPGKAKKGASA